MAAEATRFPKQVIVQKRESSSTGEVGNSLDGGIAYVVEFSAILYHRGSLKK